MANQPIFPGSIQTPVVSITDTDGMSIKTFVTAGTNGTRIDSISATSTDTVDANLVLIHNDGINDYVLGTIIIPASSGNNGTDTSVDILNDTDLPFLRGDLAHYLQSGHILKVQVQTVLSASTKIDLTAVCGDY